MRSFSAWKTRRPGRGFTSATARAGKLHRISFHREKRTGQVVFDVSQNQKNQLELDQDPDRLPVPYLTNNHWLRVVWGFGSFKIWTSGDGVHWGTADSPARNLPGPCFSLGLMVQKTEEPRQITLSHLEIRELSAITTLASDRARDKAPAFGDLANMDFGTWNETVLRSRPLDDEANPSIDMADWRRACAIRSLAESPWTPLSATLLRGLIEDGLKSGRPLNDRLRLLDEVSLLFNFAGGAEAAAMVRMYERLGTMAAAEGLPDPFGFIVTGLLTAPIWCDANTQVISPDFTRDILLESAYSRDWKELRSVAHRTEFWMRSSQPQHVWWWEKDQRELLVWARALAQHRVPVQQADEGEWVRRISRGRQFQHPLVTQVSKEGYNVMAEFEAALAGDAFADACRIITSAGRSGMAGLLPDSKDPDLLVSLPRAIALAMREHPELQQTMREQFGDVGQIRVREAMTKADVEAVEAATVRFFGTEAAAEAFGWLGDRALASGKFAQAAQAYQEALPLAGGTLARDLRNRLRLAAGMLGHEVPAEEETGPVQIASTSWNSAQFDSLIDQLRKSHARTESSGLADWNPALVRKAPPLPPARYQAVTRGNFTGDLGQGVGRYEDRNTDWAARQLAVAIEDDVVYVSNRFQVSCYQLTDGKTKWSKGLGGEQGNVHEWPFIPMPPLLVGDRIFVRRLTKRGPELASLAKASGEVLWHVRPEHHVASDPVFVQNNLLALVATVPQSGMLQLELASFHPDTGDVLSQRPLLTLRDEWSGRPPCQILATNGKILLTIGGTTLCCDPGGQPQWLEQHPWLPADVDRDSKMHHHQPPLVADGRVYVSQHGVQEVSCFDLDTGRKFWSQPVPDLVRVIGLAGGVLVAQTELGLVGFDKATGQSRWRHPVADLLNGILCGGDRLVYSCKLDYGDDGTVCLVWLDPETGTEQSLAVLKNLEGDAVRFGPLVMHDSHFWGFFGRGFKEAQRELVELVPDKDRPPAGPLHPSPLAFWVDDVLPRSFANVAAALPGWTVTTTQNLPGKDKGVTWLPDFRGERDVVQTRLANKRPVHFVREIKLSETGPQKLKLRVGHEPGHSWKLTARLGPEVLVDQVIDDKTAPGGWWQGEADLTPWAGKTVWLSVTQSPLDDTDDKHAGAAFWKTLEFTPPTTK